MFVVTGDSGQGITHGVLSGLLLKDLIVRGSKSLGGTYDPSRKTAKGIVNYISENVTALQESRGVRAARRPQLRRQA